MSSERNYSVSELYRISIARQDFFFQLQDKQFEPQYERLLQHPDQSGVLTVEQQYINKLLLAVCDGFKETSKLLQGSLSLFDDYDVAPPYFQQQRRDQIIAEMNENGAILRNLEKSVQELRGIDATDIQ